MPAYLLDQLISEQNAKLGLTNAEIAKLTKQIETPLTDEAISGLMAFSFAFQEHLEAVEESFEKKRVVIDGLDVTVEVVRREDGIYLRMKSILNPEGNFQIISAASCK